MALGPQITYLLADPEARRNLRSLLRFLSVLCGLVIVFALVFQLIMDYEGRDYSFLSGLYWTLTTMSTVGYGDITFGTELGRAFSMVVVLFGIITVLIVFPFAFIRYFYAPWIRAQVRRRAPRRLEDIEGHVIICKNDPLARGLIIRLEELGVPYCLLEPDPEVASSMHQDGLTVVNGELDDVVTFRNVQAGSARLVVANLDDAMNTHITLTVREGFPDVPVAAIIDSLASMDILELAGATHVLPLKQQLGDQLASRVNAGQTHAQIDSQFKDLVIADFPVRGTQLVGRKIRDSKLRKVTGVNIVGLWEKGKLVPAHPDTVLSEDTIVIVAGTADQVTYLDAVFVIYGANDNPVVVIGGGKVGRAAARALTRRGVDVHVIERRPELEPRLREVATRVIVGEAAHKEVLTEAGLDQAPSVVLTTNDDAVNIYLVLYCRRLRPDVRIVSRVTHAKNIKAIHRAGADFVLSYGSLGVRSVASLLHDIKLVVIGEVAVDGDSAESVGLFLTELPESLEGKTLAQSAIGASTGLSVIAIQRGEVVQTDITAATRLKPDTELIMLGTAAQREEFTRKFSR